MRTCIRIPRILLPDGDFEKWAVVACDRFPQDREYWERVKRHVGDAPSTLDFILPEAYLGEEDEERVEEACECMYRALEEGALVKLNRGMVLTERETENGVRRGILAAVDLEAYTAEAGVVSPVRASQEVSPARLAARLALRKDAPVEFPHTVLYYRDKRCRLIRALLREDLEELYSFELAEDGGHIKGYFIPEDLAEEVAQELQSGAEPYFTVADGNCSMAVAKAHWESVKKNLSAEERRNHPARFTLVELVNFYEDDTPFLPVHRLIKDVDESAFCDFIMRGFRCKQSGSLLHFDVSAEELKKLDGAIREFIRRNGGRLCYLEGGKELKRLAKEEGNVGVVVRPVEKDDFYDGLARGGVYPEKSFAWGEEREKRYYLEGKEISYD